MASVLRELSLDDFASFLDRRADAVSRLDFTVPLKECAVIIKADVKRNFYESHAPDGTPWLPLKRPRQGKRHQGSTPKPLLDQGILANSFFSDGAQGHIEEITASALTVGTNDERARIHQEGGTIHQPERSRAKPWVFPTPTGEVIFTRRIKAHDVVIPARPFAGFSAEALSDMDGILGDFLADQLGGGA